MAKVISEYKKGVVKAAKIVNGRVVKIFNLVRGEHRMITLDENYNWKLRIFNPGRYSS